MLATLHRQTWSQSSSTLSSSRLRLASLLRPRSRFIKYFPSTSAPPWDALSTPSYPPEWRQNLSTSSELPRASSKEADERVKELTDASVELYPRWLTQPKLRFSTYEEVKRPDDVLATADHSVSYKVHDVAGRITSTRLSGRKLAFLDIERDGKQLQVMLSYGAIKQSGVSEEEFRNHCRLLRRGDHVSVRGGAYRTQSGERSLKATELPTLTAPCLHRFPVVQDNDTSPQESELPLDRHVEMLSYPFMIGTLKLRDHVLFQMRRFFRIRGFYEVQTPILAGLTGGAAARPFETSATEFVDRKLSLRIAPELWLKRLIVGGMPKIYEIGPSFRNEGLDKTHNPEFTTCEFYATYHTLPMLMNLTTDLVYNIKTYVDEKPSPLAKEEFLPQPRPLRGFKQIDFIPALNQRLGQNLPTLELSKQDDVLEILKSKDIPIPANPSLQNMLDKLASHFLEPECTEPTWIVNLPECMSPLSKSFQHPSAPNNQSVAARAELFIRSKEVVNCYEEENDPFAQRRKFRDQQVYAANPAGSKADETKMADVDGMKIDEEYLRALEWGMPPTGGWGCGIDRLVMLFAGKERISDVLTFGNLRAVTRNAEKWPRKGEES